MAQRSDPDSHLLLHRQRVEAAVQRHRFEHMTPTCRTGRLVMLLDRLGALRGIISLRRQPARPSVAACVCAAA